MSQIQVFQTEWESNQTQDRQKHKEFYETLPNQKTIEWLETQIHQKEWNVHEKREEIRQRAKNGEPIVVINHLNSSEHDVLTMVHQVLTKNEFSDDSSIFVVVPSVDNDAGYSSDHVNSNVCMHMSENPLTWKKKDNLVERDPKQHKNSASYQGVKLFSKGKKDFMEEVPTDTLTYHNKEALFNRPHPKPKDDGKKVKKNKLCQITTPNEIIEGIGNRCNVISVDTTADTTVDRPCCCCSAKTNQNPNNSNNRHVAQVISNLVTPIIDKEGMTGKPFYTAMDINPRKSIKSETLALCNNAPCGPHQTPNHITAPSRQLPCAPTQQYTKAISQQSNRTPIQQINRPPIQQLSCAPTHHHTWSSNQRNTEACPTQYRTEVCPTQHRTEVCPTQHRTEVCPTQHRTEVCPTQCRPEAPGVSNQRRDEACPNENSADAGSQCQCSPELLLKLFKIAIKGDNWRGMPSYVCGECPEPQAPAPPAEPLRGDSCIEPGGPGGITQTVTEPKCPCDSGLSQPKMQIEMGETKQKRGSIRQTRFKSTVGTSTEPPVKQRKKGWFSWRKNTCECPKEPEPIVEIKAPEKKPLDFDPEPYLTLQSYFQQKDNILSEEIMKKNSLETERVSGFRLSQEKRQPPEPETIPELTAEDTIRYLALMNPELFQSIIAEHQAKLDGTYKPPPPPPLAAVQPPPPPPEGKEAGGIFKGLKFKIGGKGSGSQGLSGVCCFDLLTESFTTW